MRFIAESKIMQTVFVSLQKRGPSLFKTLDPCFRRGTRMGNFGFSYKNNLCARGFTLVEMMVVLVVVGLLIGGVLKGRQMMASSRLSSVMVQVQTVKAAVVHFRDTYEALPGDLAAAETRLANCPAGACTICVGVLPTVGGCIAVDPGFGGDGIVGRTDWNLRTSQNGAVHTSTASTFVGRETILFWTELSLAGLITGVTSAGIGNSGTPAFGTSLPAAATGGGFIVGNSNGAVAATAAGLAPNGRLAAANAYSMEGTVLVLTSAPPAAAANITAGLQPLTPAQADEIDRKVDDGLPDSGSVQAYGVTASCYSTVAPAPATGAYLGSVGSKDCGLYFLIQ